MSYHVAESIVVQAEKSKVYDAVSDFNTWTEWSPWLCCDKGAKVTVTEPSNILGAKYHWLGTVVGEGEIEHTKLIDGQRIEQRLRFIKPFKSVARVWFEFSDATQGTKVTWHMQGNLPWFLFWMKASIQQFIAMDYQRGLRMLAEYVPSGRVASDTTVGDVVSVGPYKVVGLREKCNMQEISESMDSAFRNLESKLKIGSDLSHEEIASGQMISIYHKMDIKSQVMDYTAGLTIPVNKSVKDSSLTTFEIPESKALKLRHTGLYQHLGNAWSAAHTNLRYKKLKVAKGYGGFEIYRNNPNDTDPKDLITDLYIPVR